MIPEPTLFKPESSFARAHAPNPGMACLQLKFAMPDPAPPYFHHHWLEQSEVHCPFDKKWLQEHALVVWREMGQSMVEQLREIIVVEACNPARRDAERAFYEQEDD